MGYTVKDFIDSNKFPEMKLITKTSHTPNGTCSLKIQYFS